MLEDDRRYFPPYDAVPVIERARAWPRHPGPARGARARSAGRIDEAAMRRLNHAVDGEHRAPAEVAREFLRGARLVRD